MSTQLLYRDYRLAKHDPRTNFGKKFVLPEAIRQRFSDYHAVRIVENRESHVYHVCLVPTRGGDHLVIGQTSSPYDAPTEQSLSKLLSE